MANHDQSKATTNTVFIRRAGIVVRGFPIKLLIPYIEAKKLLPADEISGNGDRWIRLDKHQVLLRYFQSQTSVVPEPPSPFAEPAIKKFEEAAGYDADDSQDKPRPPPGLETDLADLAKLLKELNG